ncbi:MAG TPA: putative metal-binding motif-containing protein [Myxococcota bacterium]|nr:putative metal-binding motif-containing protein [Myxococcota bacterium]
MRPAFSIVIAGLFVVFVACGESPENGNDIGDVSEDTFDDTDTKEPSEDVKDTDTDDNGDVSQETEVTDDDPGQDDSEPPEECVDPDGDGYGEGCAAGPDCAPDDPLKFQLVNLYVDADFDGHGVGEPIESCIGAEILPGWATNGDDCDDRDPTVYPGAPELADDGVANGCTGEDLKAATANGIFVSPDGTEDGAGTREDPVNSIKTAIQKAGAQQIKDIFVAIGDYDESLVVLNDVAIHASYNPATWEFDSQAGGTSLYSTGPVAIRAMESSLVLNRIKVIGYRSDAGSSQHTTVNGIIIEDGEATVVDTTVRGCEITTTVPDDREVSCKGLWAINSDVILISATIEGGELSIQEDSLTGPAERNCSSTAVISENSSLLLLNTSLDVDPNITIDNSAGTIKAKLAGQYLDVTGGTVAFIRGQMVSHMLIHANGIDAQDDELQVDLQAEGTGISISGLGRVYLINSNIASITANALSQVSVTSLNPVNATISNSAKSTAATVSSGTLVSLNSAAHVDFNEAGVQLGGLPEESNVSQQNLTQLQVLEVGQEGTAQIANTVFLMDGSDGDEGNNFISLLPGASLYMTHNVFWVYEGDFCKINDGTSCVVQKTDDDFSKCAEDAGCLLIENMIEADPKYGEYPHEVEPGSPLIDNGIDPSELGFSLTTDLNNDDRPKGAGYDIGPVEFE